MKVVACGFRLCHDACGSGFGAPARLPCRPACKESRCRCRYSCDLIHCRTCRRLTLPLFPRRSNGSARLVIPPPRGPVSDARAASSFLPTEAARHIRHEPPAYSSCAYRAPAPACPTGTGSQVGLEVMPIASVTLSDGHGSGRTRADPPFGAVIGADARPWWPHRTGILERSDLPRPCCCGVRRW